MDNNWRNWKLFSYVMQVDKVSGETRVGRIIFKSEKYDYALVLMRLEVLWLDDEMQELYGFVEC